MKLGHREEVFNPAEDHRWLGSKHATDTARTVTLDASAFEGEFGDDGVIPSGVVLAPVGDGLYGPAGADGAGDPEGFLLTTKDTAGYTVDTPAALHWHGSVVVANLPEGHGLTAAIASALPLFHFVGEVV